VTGVVAAAAGCRRRTHTSHFHRVQVRLHRRQVISGALKKLQLHLYTYRVKISFPSTIPPRSSSEEGAPPVERQLSCLFAKTNSHEEKSNGQINHLIIF
jgi:hypothetical protein